MNISFINYNNRLAFFEISVQNLNLMFQKYMNEFIIRFNLGNFQLIDLSNYP